MANGSNRDYRVGYGKPPPETQFKPGRSGNPRGRPRGTKDFATAAEEELNARLRVTENGRRRRISKLQALVKVMVNKAVAGDLKAIPPLIALLRLGDAQGVDASPADVQLPEDQEVIRNILNRLKRLAEDSNGETGPDNPAQKPTLHKDDDTE